MSSVAIQRVHVRSANRAPTIHGFAGVPVWVKTAWVERPSRPYRYIPQTNGTVDARLERSSLVVDPQDGFEIIFRYVAAGISFAVVVAALLFVWLTYRQ